MPNPLLALSIAILFLLMTFALFWPEKGLWPRWTRYRRLSDRILGEDALKHLYKAEADGHPPTLQSVSGALQININRSAELVRGMEEQGFVSSEHGEVRLTSEGRKYALHVIRAHRLWERYLAEETGYSETDWHNKAHEYEHSLSVDELNTLAARLGNPMFDPHGDPIPTATGEIIHLGGQPLTDLVPNTPARIVHLENEPQAVYAQLVASGLYPGQEIRVIEASPQRILFWADGEELVLAPVVAANVEVLALPKDTELSQSEGGSQTLFNLKPGNSVAVVGLSPRLRGAERRRLMDLGILPGTVIQSEMMSPSGETTAYRIRGALIALRREQSQVVLVSPSEERLK